MSIGVVIDAVYVRTIRIGRDGDDVSEKTVVLVHVRIFCDTK